jgi:hypothetical protein
MGTGEQRTGLDEWSVVRGRAAGWRGVSEVALWKRLRAAEEWSRWLAEGLWRGTERPENGGGYRVRAVNATTVQEPGRTGTDRRAHDVINLVSLPCEHLEWTDVRGGETSRRIPAAPGDLLLGDHAYRMPTRIAHLWPAGVRCGPPVCAGRLMAVERGRQATPLDGGR